MSTIIREEFFLVDAVDPPVKPNHYHRFRERERFRNRMATSLNTLPPDYDHRVKRYNKSYVEVWNTEEQRWDTVSIPAYAENIVYDNPNDDVVDVYDESTGTYKKRIERISCECCGRKMDRYLYVVKDTKIVKVCGLKCAGKVRNTANFVPYQELVKQVEAKEDLSAFACKACGKIPASIENSITTIHTEGTPNDSDFFCLACSFKCALELKEEYDKRKRL